MKNDTSWQQQLSQNMNFFNQQTVQIPSKKYHLYNYSDSSLIQRKPSIQINHASTNKKEQQTFSEQGLAIVAVNDQINNNNTDGELLFFKETTQYQQDSSEEGSNRPTQRCEDRPPSTSSLALVNTQLLKLNPGTPQSISVHNPNIPTSNVDPFLQQPPQQQQLTSILVMSRSEWLTFFKAAYEKLQGNTIITKQLLSKVFETNYQRLPLKPIHVYLKSSSAGQQKPEKWLSHNQIQGILQNNSYEQIYWDDLMEQMLTIVPEGYNLEWETKIKQKVKKTMLKDGSMLIDLSNIESKESMSLQEMLNLITEFDSEQRQKIKALSMATLQSISFDFDRSLQQNLAILNLSGLGNTFQQCSHYRFEQLQFLNISYSNLTDISFVNEPHFPKLKELIASQNLIGRQHQDTYYDNRQQLPITLKLLDLSYNSLQEMQDLTNLVGNSPHFNLLVLNLKGNPIDEIIFDELKMWFPCVHTVLINDDIDIRNLSCFENFSELAFKQPQMNAKSAQQNIFNQTKIDALGGLTISAQNSPPKQVQIDLRPILKQPLNRQLDFTLSHDIDTPSQQNTQQSQEQLFPEEPQNIHVKNDSLKYFNHFNKESDYQQFLYNQSSSSNNLFQQQNESYLVTARNQYVEQFPRSQSNLIFTTSVDITPKKHNHHYSQQSQQYNPSNMIYSEDKRTYQHLINSSSQLLKQLNTTNNDNDQLACYYDKQIQNMSVSTVQAMPKREVYKVQHNSHYQNEKQQKIASPIKAMMIQKPSGTGKSNNDNKTTSFSSLSKVGNNPLKSTQSFINLLKQSHISEKQIIRPQSSIIQQQPSRNAKSGSGLNTSCSLIQMGSVDDNVSPKQQQAPQRFGYSNNSRSKSQQQKGKDSIIDLRELLANESKQPTPIRTSQPKTRDIQVKGDLTFNNNTNASGHNSSRNKHLLLGLESSSITHMKASHQSSTSSYFNIPEKLITLHYPHDNAQMLRKKMPETILDNNNSQHLQFTPQILHSGDTPRFSERGSVTQLFQQPKITYDPNQQIVQKMGIPYNNSNSSREDQYSQAIQMIKAQRARNERKKSMIIGKTSGGGGMMSQGNNRRMMSRGGGSSSGQQVKINQSGRGVGKAMGSTTQSTSSHNRMSTSASLKIDLRRTSAGRQGSNQFY